MVLMYSVVWTRAILDATDGMMDQGAIRLTLFERHPQGQQDTIGMQLGCRR